ncbi:hypothetical protein ACP3W2_27445, partial [Salmonella enterica]|uniref:hypothetical protein n=1 Tax=Salmonella enterica TaxID=28901 RepID=UPI003CEF3352
MRFGINVVPESGTFEAGEVLEIIARTPGVSMFAAPTMVRRLTESPVEAMAENIRTIVWGGAPMHLADTRR